MENQSHLEEESLEHYLDDLDHYTRKIKQVWTLGWTASEMRQSVEQTVKMMEQIVEKARTKINT
jgi:hypothetical protein